MTTPTCTLCLNSPTERVVFRPRYIGGFHERLLCDRHVDTYTRTLKDLEFVVVGLSDVEAGS